MKRQSVLFRFVLSLFLLFVGGEAFAWTYDNATWMFRIKNLDDQTAVDSSKAWLRAFTRGQERVELMMLSLSAEVKYEELTQGEKTMSDMGTTYTRRFTYQYFKKLDSLTLSGYSSFHLVSEKRRPFSCKLTRIYESSSGKKLKTVGYYTKNTIYHFTEVYTDEPLLLDEVLAGFKSSLIGNAQGLFAVWGDIVGGEKDKGFRHWVGRLVNFFLKTMWPLIIIIPLIFKIVLPQFTAQIWFLGVLILVPCLFIISFLCCHDDFMNWVMGYGEVWPVLGGVVIAIADVFSSD